jgi:hypothetical protein
MRLTYRASVDPFRPPGTAAAGFAFVGQSM